MKSKIEKIIKAAKHAAKAFAIKPYAFNGAYQFAYAAAKAK